MSRQIDLSTQRQNRWRWFGDTYIMLEAPMYTKSYNKMQTDLDNRYIILEAPMFNKGYNENLSLRW